MMSKMLWLFVLELRGMEQAPVNNMFQNSVASGYTATSASDRSSSWNIGKSSFGWSLPSKAANMSCLFGTFSQNGVGFSSSLSVSGIQAA